MTLIFDLRGERAIQQFAGYRQVLDGFSLPPEATLKAHLSPNFDSDPITLGVEVLEGGAIAISLTAVQTALLRSGSYYWELLASSDEEISRLAEGKAIVRAGIASFFDEQPNPQPLPAVASSIFSTSFTAAQNLSALRVVATSDAGLIYASNDSIDTAFTALGVTIAAVLAGQQTQALITGIITNDGWAWAANLPIFLGEEGQLTQIAPSSGFLLPVARPLASNQILVELQEPSLL